MSKLVESPLITLTIHSFNAGHHSKITRLPYEGLGIAVFTNDDLFGPYIHDIIKFYLIDRALGLETIDWNSQ